MKQDCRFMGGPADGKRMLVDTAMGCIKIKTEAEYFHPAECKHAHHTGFRAVRSHDLYLYFKQRFVNAVGIEEIVYVAEGFSITLKNNP